MKILDGRPRLSASDLANHLACRHLTALNLQCAEGKRERSHWRDAEVDALAKRGEEHEAAYLDHLEAQGLEVLRLEQRGDEGFELTKDAMRRGVPVIAQAVLISGRWLGYADVFLRVDVPSELGDWSYEVIDTKLARETKGGTVLQLCLYSEIVGEIQGRLPGDMHVVSPGAAEMGETPGTPAKRYEPETFRVLDHLAYHRHVKRRLEEALAEGGEARLPDPREPHDPRDPHDPHATGEGEQGATYPEPCAHCDICDWRWLCDKRRHDDDHLSLVAGISRSQRMELVEREVATLAELARMALPMEPRPKRGARESYVRVREQARVQLEGREKAARVHELLELEEGRGLARLPEPAPGDVFLDFEGDRYVADGGLEFLFGVVVGDEHGRLGYQKRWARDRAEEKAAFEWLMDLIAERWERDPGMHVYHYGVYEPGTLKRLMGRYATREEELDRMLRGERLIDLHAVVKESLRASVERYSLKDMEAFCGYERELDLEQARAALRRTQHALEHGDPRSIDEQTMEGVAAYNREDCEATLALRDWLEGLRGEAIASGEAIARPELKSGDPEDDQEERKKEIQILVEDLKRGVPVEPAERTAEDDARWTLAHLMEWHWRERKVRLWEHIRLRELDEEDLMEERYALTRLVSEGKVGTVKKREVHRFRFPSQEASLEVGKSVRMPIDTFKDQKVGEVEALDLLGGTVDLKMSKKSLQAEFRSVFFDKDIRAGAVQDSIRRLGRWVADHGIDADGPHRAARDLLLRRPPRRLPAEEVGEPLLEEGEKGRHAALRLVSTLDHGTLPIQGPPGTGKSYTGALMILKLVGEGKKVGVSALSHRAIQNLLKKTMELAAKQGVSVRAMRKGEPDEHDHADVQVVKDNADVEAALRADEIDVAGGTPFLWSREEFFESVDVLFVDEAGQLALANVLAMGQGGKSLVLLGDPQQLEQPQQGTHTEGAEASALEHVLGEAQTIEPTKGLLLETTWRMHAAVCEPISELFYGGKLSSMESLQQQRVSGASVVKEPGLVFVPVEHEGNRNGSPEEVEVVQRLVAELTKPGVEWTDWEGEEKPMTLADVLVVAPYNVQVGALRRALPRGAKVGTVDKFQGQEAPVVIYSLATSTPEEAPRGMEFLYSPNRLNVAISRARCNAILVANPALFEPECKTPKQIRLANAFCRMLEVTQ